MQDLTDKAAAVHIAALNLANTLGIFHGVNDALEDGEAAGPGVRAINVIQSDLLHLLVIRVCALCEASKNRADDASIAILVSAIGDQKVREGLIETDERWRDAIGPRAEKCASVRQSIKELERQWAAVVSPPDVLERLYRFRKKRLGHVTVANPVGREAQLQELWLTARKVLTAASQVRLIFYREDFDYLKSSSMAGDAAGQLMNVLKKTSITNGHSKV